MTNNQLTDVKYFTKKPVTISAIQWTGDNLPDVIAFTGKSPRWEEWFVSMDDYISHVKNDGNRFKIFTLEGVMDALPGDWIIRGVQGEHYPCKPDIFAKTYAPAELQERRKAAMDSEPVAWTDAEELRDAKEGGCGYLFGVGRDANKFADPRRQIMLYRHAQPASVVPEDIPDSVYEILCQACGGKAWMYEEALWNACRAAMLQAGNSPVHGESRCGIKAAPALDFLPKNAESRCDNSPVNGVTNGKPLTIILPDITSKAFWSGTGKTEIFHPETYCRWVKEAIERYCAIARIDVEVK